MENEGKIVKAKRSNKLAETKQDRAKLYAEVFTKNGRSWWRDENGLVRNLPKYEDPAELVEAIEEWEQSVLVSMQNGTEIVPDVEALAVGIGVSLPTLKEWKKGTRGEDIKQIVTMEFAKLAMIKNQMAMKGEIPPLVWTVAMNNNHDYVQNQKIDIDVTAKREPMKEADLIKQADLLPG